MVFYYIYRKSERKEGRGEGRRKEGRRRGKVKEEEEKEGARTNFSWKLVIHAIEDRA